MPHRDEPKEQRHHDATPSGDQRPLPYPVQMSKSQSQQSLVARSAMMNSSNMRNSTSSSANNGSQATNVNGSLAPPPRSFPGHPKSTDGANERQAPRHSPEPRQAQDGVALNDTPSTTAPSSPNIHPLPPPRRQSSGDKSRNRPTTLDIPGLTKSRVSPDGKIASRDVGSKLVIVMVGLPARGKSYITKKMARYLNWLQHDAKIFNVGERRRVAAGGKTPATSKRSSMIVANHRAMMCHLNEGEDAPRAAARVLVNSKASPEMSDPRMEPPTQNLPDLQLPEPRQKDDTRTREGQDQDQEPMDQSAAFFEPSNTRAKALREQAAVDTLDELLDYILHQGGSVGILDATNSTLERRETVMNHIQARAGPDLNVLFLESLCLDQNLLERNMRLKLSGPDYRGKDPETSLEDFRKRVQIYEKGYVSLGDYEERRNIPYVQMIDVGRKVISHQIKGFLSAQAVYYLLNFNLAPRQIWICRHGQSVDNVTGRIGGDAPLTPYGRRFSRALTKFVIAQRREWELLQLEKERNASLPPRPGDHTPPNPAYELAAAGANPQDYIERKGFCVWTSMLQRSIQTAEHFPEEDFELKQMRMLDELFSGHLEGLTYAEILDKYPEEYHRRKADKLHYRYPGPGGEGYLDVINRLRPVIVELERMTDHCLLVTHRSVCRVLLAYFLGLGREKVAQLEVPLGVVFGLEPKPYGVDFKAYRYVPPGADAEMVDHAPEARNPQDDFGIEGYGAPREPSILNGLPRRGRADSEFNDDARVLSREPNAIEGVEDDDDGTFVLDENYDFNGGGIKATISHTQ